MSKGKEIFLIGYASDLAARKKGASEGPFCLLKSNFMNALEKRGLLLNWQKMIQMPENKISNTQAVFSMCQKLSVQVFQLATMKKFFVVLGGDHSSAIGTWSGAANSLQKAQSGDVGLIWIDAHMDSHTPESSESGNIHGMPLATLLGHGEGSLLSLSKANPAFKPENVCLVGVHSYEPSEGELLKKLGVRVFLMDELNARGLPEVLADARKIVTCNTSSYGISLDIDSIDPRDAPATGVTESGGIRANDLIDELKVFAGDPLLMGFEIVEFDPTMDIDKKTEKLVPELIAAITLGLE